MQARRNVISFKEPNDEWEEGGGERELPEGRVFGEGSYEVVLVGSGVEG